MEQQIQAYLGHIRNDYANWIDRLMDNRNLKIKAQMIEEFWNGVRVEEGRTYIKVVTRTSVTSVHSFIVKEDGPKFRKGDILKAASWKAPAKNFARGNILDEKWSNTTWAGA